MDEEAGITAMADDYAFLIWAGIELYQATFEPSYLETSLEWNQLFVEKFWDNENGGFYLSITDEDQVYGRQKQIYDGAIPSANSVSMINGIRLSRLTGNTSLETYTDQIGKAFSVDLIRSGSSITQSMQAIQFLNADAKEISLIGETEEVEEVLSSVCETFTPFSVMHVVRKENWKQLAEIAAYTSTQNKQDGRTTLYVCENFKCEKPVSGRTEIKKVLA